MQSLTYTVPASTNIDPYVAAVLTAYPAWNTNDPEADRLITERNQREDGQIDIVVWFPDSADPEQLDAVIKAVDPSQWVDPGAGFKNQILTMAQSAVGVRLQDLTNAQIKALMAALLFQAGGIAPATVTVRPLAEWM
jgi:hypothetical protein